MADAGVGVYVGGGGSGEGFTLSDDEMRRLLDVATTELDGVVKVVKSSVSVPPDPGDWSRLTEGATVAITGFGG